MLLLPLLLACSNEPGPPAALPGPCAVLAAPAPGPSQSERAAAADQPRRVAVLFMDEARATGDPGYYTLAESAASCALERDPRDLDARRIRAHVWHQTHRFAEAEAEGRELVAQAGTWQDYAVLGDALLERGRLDEASVAFQEAVNRHAGVETYARVAGLRQAWGDLPGAIEMQVLAVQDAQALHDPEFEANALVGLGVLHSLVGAPALELDRALEVIPGYPSAHFYRGRIRLHAGDREGALADLRRAGDSFETARALAELDPTVDPASRCAIDNRGCAFWIAPKEPARALEMMNRELQNRQDATTRMVHAWAAFHSGQDAHAEVRAALDTGTIEPRALLIAGILERNRKLLDKALATGPGLLPSERKMAEAALAEIGP